MAGEGAGVVVDRRLSHRAAGQGHAEGDVGARERGTPRGVRACDVFVHLACVFEGPELLLRAHLDAAIRVFH